MAITERDELVLEVDNCMERMRELSEERNRLTKREEDMRRGKPQSRLAAAVLAGDPEAKKQMAEMEKEQAEIKPKIMTIRQLKDKAQWKLNEARKALALHDEPEAVKDIKLAVCDFQKWFSEGDNLFARLEAAQRVIQEVCVAKNDFKRKAEVRDVGFGLQRLGEMKDWLAACTYFEDEKKKK